MSLFRATADLLDPPQPPTVDDVWTTIGWTPQPKQATAQHRATQAFELLFGGAVGGGKSEWLLAHVVAEMRHPGNRGLILRRDTRRLARSLLPRAETLLAGHARHNKNDNTFTFPNGSVIEFGHLEHDTSVHIYQGAEYGIIAFEEVTEFLESQWTYLATRARAPVPGVVPHMVATANPGGVGHRWVKRRWIRPDPDDIADGDPTPGDVWSARSPDPDEQATTRCFVPSTIADNPILTARDPGYLARVIASQPTQALRRALAEGDWDAIDAVEGALWHLDALDAGRRSPDWVVGGAGGLVRVVVGVDPATTSKSTSDETGIVVAGKAADGRFYILDDRSIQGASPAEWGARAVQAWRDHQGDRIVAEQNQGGDMVAHVIATVDETVPVKLVWASRGKKIRAEPIAALYEQGRVSHVRVFPELEEQLTTWTPESGDSPDRLDALVWALTELSPGGGLGEVSVTRW